MGTEGRPPFAACGRTRQQGQDWRVHDNTLFFHGEAPNRHHTHPIREARAHTCRGPVPLTSFSSPRSELTGCTGVFLNFAASSPFVRLAFVKGVAERARMS